MAAAGIGGATGPAFGGAIAGWLGAQAVFVAFVPLYALLAASVLAARRTSSDHRLQPEPAEGS
jgi:fucose permease